MKKTCGTVIDLCEIQCREVRSLGRLVRDKSAEIDAFESPANVFWARWLLYALARGTVRAHPETASMTLADLVAEGNEPDAYDT